MQTADYLIIALVLATSGIGLLRGFLREGIALLSWLIAVLIAWHVGPSLEPNLGGLLAAPEVRPWAARAILLIGVLLLGAGIGALVAYFVRSSFFSGMDRLLGFVLGLLRGLVILGVVVLACETVRLDGERWWHRSMLLPYGEHLANAMRSVGGGETLKRHRDVTVRN
jgi:membrane protein required for colicin V production